MLTSYNIRGPILHKSADIKEIYRQPLEWILNSNNVEVYLARESGNRTDPEFWMATNHEVLVRFAITGDMLGMYKKSETGTVDTVVEMDPKHRFHLDRKTLPINGVIDNPRLTDEQVLETLVDYAYNKAKEVSDSNSTGAAKHFQVLTYDAIVARFNLLKTIQSATDIIPDQSPRTIFVKAGDGCPMECVYCDEGLSKFIPYSEKKFTEHIELIGTALTDILGSERIRKMNEGFINISDIGWLDIYAKKGKTDLTSVRAAELMRKHFPWLEKIGAFIGSKTALELSRDEYGNYQLNRKGQRYSSNFFKRLWGSAELINRAYIGIETSDDRGSALIGKPITYQQKLLAANLIQDANIRLKAIVQLGVLGKGFYPLGADISTENFVPWYKATDLTADWVNEVRPYRVLESVYQPSKNPKMQKLLDEGRIIPYDNPEQFENERERLRERVRVNRNQFRIEKDYEGFLPIHPYDKGMVISQSRIS